MVAARPVTAHEAELLLLPRRWAFLLLFRLAAIAGVAVQTARRGQIFTACIREKKKEGDKGAELVIFMLEAMRALSDGIEVRNLNI